MLLNDTCEMTRPAVFKLFQPRITFLPTEEAANYQQKRTAFLVLCFLNSTFPICFIKQGCFLTVIPLKKIISFSSASVWTKIQTEI